MRSSRKSAGDYRTNVAVNGTSKLSHRSQSTPRMDEVDCSYDSSTLSDDDSTPHVSRSNSRGKDYRAVNSAWETAYGALTVPVPAPIHIIVSQDGSGGVKVAEESTPKRGKDSSSSHWSDPRSQPRSQRHSSGAGCGDLVFPSLPHLKVTTPSSSDKSERIYDRADRRCSGGNSSRTQIYATPVAAAASAKNAHSTGSSRSSYGSDYDTIKHHSSGSRSRADRYMDTTPAEIPTYEEALIRRRMPTNWTTWKDDSANLLQVRASPVRLNVNDSCWSNDSGNSAPPLPPKSEPPPLPPKQTIHLRSPSSSSTMMMMTTTPASGVNTTPVKMRSSSSSGISSGPRIRPVTIHMDMAILENQTPPPSLPRKERSAGVRKGSNVSVVSIENNYTPLHRSFAFSTHNLRHAMENAMHKEDWSKEELEQTDYKTKDQEIQTSGHWSHLCEMQTQTSLSPQPSLSSDSGDSARTPAVTGKIRTQATVTMTTTPARYEKNSSYSSDASRCAKLRSMPEQQRREVESTAVTTPAEKRGRDRIRQVVLHRSQSLPPLDKANSDNESESDSSSSDDEDCVDSAATPQGSTSQSTLRRGEISWSVSQLRALFSGNSSNSSASPGVTIPPPYRSPPVGGSSGGRKRVESSDSYGEESYV